MIGKEGIVQGLGQRQDLFKELLHWFGPELLVIAARGFGLEAFAVLEPGGSQAVELRAADLQPLQRGGAIHLAAVEQIQYFHHR